MGAQPPPQTSSDLVAATLRPSCAHLVLGPRGTHRAPVSVWHPSPGYIAYRHDKDGSCFIQTLVDVFTENKGPILELLTEVSSSPSLVTRPTHMPGIQWRSTPAPFIHPL